MSTTHTIIGGPSAGTRLRMLSPGVLEMHDAGEWIAVPLYQLRRLATEYPVGKGPWPWLKEHGVRRPSPSGPGGRRATAEERREAGMRRIDVWVSEAARERLDDLARRDFGGSTQAALEAIILATK